MRGLTDCLIQGAYYNHDSSIHCDNLISLQKSVLTNFIATLSAEKLAELDQALVVALDLPPDLFS